MKFRTVVLPVLAVFFATLACQTLGSISPTPQPTYTPMPKTQTSDKDDMVMVYIPEGEFLMGSTNEDHGADGNEFPQHNVKLDAYWIDKHEVTNTQCSLNKTMVNGSRKVVMKITQ